MNDPHLVAMRRCIATRLDGFYQHASATDAPEAHRWAVIIEA